MTVQICHTEKVTNHVVLGLRVRVPDCGNVLDSAPGTWGPLGESRCMVSEQFSALLGLSLQ